MTAPRPAYVVTATAIVTAVVGGLFGWYEIDRSAPFSYQAAYFDREEAKAGETVNLTLRIRWPRTNCSTELERTFIGSDGKIYKVLDAQGRSTVKLGPPPGQILDANKIAASTREVRLPAGLPPGIAIHSPNAWERCTSPAKTWGDYLTDLWPIFVGPKGADATIRIVR